jgi:hypothetical protein
MDRFLCKSVCTTSSRMSDNRLVLLLIDPLYQIGRPGIGIETAISSWVQKKSHNACWNRGIHTWRAAEQIALSESSGREVV